MMWNKETVTEARKRLNITQEIMAEELQCRQQTISKWEMGHVVPSPAYQQLLTIYFNKKLGER